LSGDTLYGTATGGGNAGNGTVFAIRTNGSGFTVLHHFSQSFPNTRYGGLIYTNIDGTFPWAVLLNAGMLYGTTHGDGPAGAGTLFAVKTNGTGFRVLHSFTRVTNNINADGFRPVAGAISGNTLYGVTSGGGLFGNGTIFAVNTDDTSFTNLHTFTSVGNGTNSDGANPYARMTLVGDILYGTTLTGGAAACGTVFSLNCDGSCFTVLYSFTQTNYSTALIPSRGTFYSSLDFSTEVRGPIAIVRFAFAPPQLSILRSGSYALLAWPDAATCFSLQSTTDPLGPNTWVSVPGEPVVINGAKVVVDTVSGPARFYRLIK
jgi:uncharacterized repeat protein (TIGR03803 family)